MTSLDPAIASVVAERIVRSPFGDLVGLGCEAVDVDRVRVRLPFRPEVTTVGETVHGGAIASLVDVAATAAAWAHPDASPRARGSTAGFSLSFLAPGLGCDLVAEATVVQRGRSLCVCDVSVSDTGGRAVARALVTYRLSLPRPSQAPEAPARELVRAYAAAKSRQDVEAALALCDASFRIETLPFGTASQDRDETARHLRLFFSVFPDYAAETEGLAVSGDEVAWWGRVSLSFQGGLAGLAPTGRRASLPAFSVFELRDGRLTRERFFFDLGMLCDGIGVAPEAMAAALRGLRAAAA